MSESQLPSGVPACARTKALPPLRLFLACVPRTSAPYLFGYAASSPSPQRLPLHPTPPPRCFPPHSAFYCLPLHRPTSSHTGHSDARPTCCCPLLDQSSGKRGRAGHDGRAAVRALHFNLLPVHRRRHSSRPRWGCRRRSARQVCRRLDDSSGHHGGRHTRVPPHYVPKCERFPANILCISVPPSAPRVGASPLSTFHVTDVEDGLGSPFELRRHRKGVPYRLGAAGHEHPSAAVSVLPRGVWVCRVRLVRCELDSDAVIPEIAEQAESRTATVVMSRKGLRRAVLDRAVIAIYETVATAGEARSSSHQGRRSYRSFDRLSLHDKTVVAEAAHREWVGCGKRARRGGEGKSQNDVKVYLLRCNRSEETYAT